jgi:hypothetical protein
VLPRTGERNFYSTDKISGEYKIYLATMQKIGVQSIENTFKGEEDTIMEYTKTGGDISRSQEIASKTCSGKLTNIVMTLQRPEPEPLVR